MKKRVIDDSGFLGSHLSDRLPERGHRVIGLISQFLDAMVVLAMDWLGCCLECSNWELFY